MKLINNLKPSEELANISEIEQYEHIRDLISTKALEHSFEVIKDNVKTITHKHFKELRISLYKAVVKYHPAENPEDIKVQIAKMSQDRMCYISDLALKDYRNARKNDNGWVTAGL